MDIPEVPGAPMTGAEWPRWAVRTLLGLLSATGSVAVLQLIVGRVRGTAVTRVSSPKGKIGQQAAFRKFQWQYLTVYFIIQLADWLQGTNMYALYQSYGVNVAGLFCIGFLSSCIFGTVVGLKVDRWGRRAGCVLYCVVEVVVNLLEHTSNVPLLIVGRVLGGISNSLLCSAFESWMVSAHRRRQFDEALLADTFGWMSAGNGVVAIVAGLVAQVSADALGDIGPFQAAIGLTVAALLFIVQWEENFGDQDGPEGNGPPVTVMSSLRADPRIVLLGANTALFEGAMYTFVFIWVPALLAVVPSGNLPEGLVFSSFMVTVTAGGMLFSTLNSVARTEVILVVVYFSAAAAMAVPIFVSQFVHVLSAFLVIEMCVGMFFPCAATMRSRLLPDHLQSTMMNIFLVPRSALVVAGTMLSDYTTLTNVFALVSCWFFLAGCCQVALLACSVRLQHAKIH
mmetsp:Transcript_78913/g.210794  ORF Transcript_78913/g.210794 Transcript_78913/m.210794 type:complete len:454 (-) Transcript_78913:67-1428(-)